MEQIVKIFVHQSYFIENDLVVDYNVQQGAHINVSAKDWIALIPKGWTGVDEQVAFKTVDTDCDVNLAIKSVIMEKKCFQNVVECEKQYQLMYIGQYLEILGKSEYFVFHHQSGLCSCVSSTKTKSKGDLKQIRLSSVFSCKSQRRQSPTPREFYKNRPQSCNTVIKTDKLKPKQCTSDTCAKCNAPTNFAVLESAYLTKIQDLTINNEMMENRLLKVENDLVDTLDVVNKQLELNKTLSEEKDKNQKFIDDVVDGLLNDGKITFWARNDEFSVVREFPDKNHHLSLLLDDCPALSSNISFNSSKEAYMKAVIRHQEQTIQYLVNKIKDSFDIFLKVNTQVTDQSNSSLILSENEINNVSYVDISGTTYFLPPPYIANTSNNLNLNSSRRLNNIKIETNKNTFKEINNTVSNYGLSDAQECKLISTINQKMEDIIPTFEDREKDKNDSTLFTPFTHYSTKEKTNSLDIIKPFENLDTSENDDSL